MIKVIFLGNRDSYLDIFPNIITEVKENYNVEIILYIENIDIKIYTKNIRHKSMFVLYKSSSLYPPAPTKISTV